MWLYCRIRATGIIQHLCLQNKGVKTVAIAAVILPAYAVVRIDTPAGIAQGGKTIITETEAVESKDPIASDLL